MVEEIKKQDKTEEADEVVEEQEKGVVDSEISEEMRSAYIDYAMSVIVSRALPAVEDGLKPVHRRILYAMDKLGLDKGHTVKSARIVGDTMGKYHPHGDMSIYDSLVRMAQDFSLRYPLVLGQGNFGCFTADTRVKLTDGRDLSFAELIEENNQGKRNFTFTINENQEVKIAEIKNPRKTRDNAEIMKVMLDNGEEIKCTLNHKFMLRDGSYKEAKDLQSGDSLMPLYSRLSTKSDNPNFGNDKNLILCEINGNHKVVRIEFLNESADVYDLTIDKTHNFALASGIFVHNSLDGDNAAASRYTEAKLAAISQELLEDLEKGTVKMLPNFDNSLEEPETLPGKLPNLLINGASGIAVGMATNIPPHNLTEVCDGITAYINNPEITIEKLCEIIQGPDFPTGGQVNGDFIELYKTGKGRLVLRGKTTTEEHKGKISIIITEIPYMLNKAELVTAIAKLVQEKKLPDISDIKDESAKGKVRIVIELRKGTDYKFTLNRLYTFTRLQDNFDVNIIALVRGHPKQLNLKQIIEEYVKYRQIIVTKRTKFDLKKAEDRLEIVKGLLIALKDIDNIIELIKKAEHVTDAKDKLVKKYSLTLRQAEAILEIKLAALTKLESEKLREEEKKLIETIKALQKILSSTEEILSVIKKEVSELKRKYGDTRITQIMQRISEIQEKDLISKKDVVVTITEKGYCKRIDVKDYREQRRGGKGVIGSDLATGDFVKQMLTCSTHDYLMLFTNRGRVYWLKAYEIPAAEKYSKGKALINMIGLKDETIQSIMAVHEFKDLLMMVTKLGQVKKMSLSLLSKPRASGVRVMNLPLDNSDSVVDIKLVKDKQEVLLVTGKGQAIRFNSEEVRAMGRASYGVTGIKLDKGDEVKSLEVLSAGDTILSITKLGYGKRSDIEDYRLTGRAGKGVINLKVSDKTGDVVTTVDVNESDSAIVTTAKGMVIRSAVKELRVMGRATQGVRIVKLQAGDEVTDLVRIPREEEVSE